MISPRKAKFLPLNWDTMFSSELNFSKQSTTLLIQARHGTGGFRDCLNLCSQLHPHFRSLWQSLPSYSDLEITDKVGLLFAWITSGSASFPKQI